MNRRGVELHPAWLKPIALKLNGSRLLLAGFMLRLFLSQYGTYPIDFNTWRAWGNTLSEVGFGQFYQSTWCDYLPGYLYILRGLDVIQGFLPWLSEEILFKFPANLADLGIALLIFWVLKPLTGPGRAQLASLVYFFNPAVLANSTFWGQIDSIHALLILLSVLLGLGEVFWASGVLIALSFMVKPQSLILVPVLSFFLLRFSLRQPPGQRLRRGLHQGTLMAIAMVVTVWLLVLPFVSNSLTLGTLFTEPFGLLQSRFAATYQQYTFASFNAFNVWGAWAMRQSDQSIVAGLTYQHWGTLLFAGFYSLIMGFLLLPELRQYRNLVAQQFWLRIASGDGLRFCQGGQATQRGSSGAPAYALRAASYGHRLLFYRAIAAVTLILFALFLWITRAHERHLLPVIVLMSLLTGYSPPYRWLYGIVSGIYVLNMSYAYGKITSGYSPSWVDPWIPALFGILLGVFMILLISFIHRSLQVIPASRQGNDG